MTKQTESQDILNNEELRKKFKTSLRDVVEYFKNMDALREGVKDTIADISAEYGIDKKTVRKVARTMHKSNYGSHLEEEKQFQLLYETVVEGRARDDDNDSAE